jgi:hypothetical protein
MNDLFSFIALVSFHGIFGTPLVPILPGSLTYVLTQTLTYVLKLSITDVLKLDKWLFATPVPLSSFNASVRDYPLTTMWMDAIIISMLMINMLTF